MKKTKIKKPVFQSTNIESKNLMKKQDKAVKQLLSAMRSGREFNIKAISSGCDVCVDWLTETYNFLK